ncbi:MAG: STAS domain-containing protein [Gammaproteobacteria bacterium]|nr:STAS domain-containing protein [Gammaproteobacteria bacterium]MDH5653884.1 STAS domain-containing protein [Gammaproteobacteria bacterium]
MGISQSVADGGKEVTISIDGRFDFNVHQDFRGAYRDQRPDAKYVIKMNGTDYIDSSALGMLLLLREHAGNDSADITITGCKDEIKKILSIANFERLFKIS